MATQQLTLSNLSDRLISTGPMVLQRQVVRAYGNGSLFYSDLIKKNRIKKKRAVGRSFTLRLSVNGNKTIIPTSPYGKFRIQKQTYLNQAEFDWAFSAGSIVLSENDIHENSGEAQELDILDTAMEETAFGIKERENALILRGVRTDSNDTGPYQIIGLRETIAGGGDDGATHLRPVAYGGLNATLAPGYQGNVKVSTGLANLVSDMDKVFEDCCYGGQEPDMVLTDQKGYALYKSKLTGNIRYTDVKVGDASFARLEFQGKPVWYDRDVGRPSIFTFDADGNPTETTVMTGNNLVTGTNDAASTHPFIFPNIDTFVWLFDDQWNMDNAIDKKPRQPVDEFTLIWPVRYKHQLVSTNRRLNGVLTDVPES